MLTDEDEPRIIATPTCILMEVATKQVATFSHTVLELIPRYSSCVLVGSYPTIQASASFLMNH